MPPQNSFNIKQNTPEADKLERRLHEHLKEIWDPAADATVARYLTAMLAKGYDRKKIHSQLKAILQESVTVQLLEWLYKHLRLHGNEYQSKEAPASLKPAPKPPASAAKVVPTEEVELRLEDLEAQQLEGSDLEDETEVNDTAPVPASMAAGASGPSRRIDASEPQERDRGVSEQDQPPEPAVRSLQAHRVDDRNGVGAHPAEKPEQRSERRHREPIPVPNFSDHPRSRPGGGVGPTAAQQSRTAHGDAATGTSSQPPKPQQQAREQDEQQLQAPSQPPAPTAERRRLKSSVVLDWETWQKQKQPADDRRGAKPAALSGKLAAAERAPIPSAAQDGADPATSPREREDRRGRDRERDRERGRDRSTGAGRRRQASEAEADRAGPRHRDGDGDASVRRGHDREGEAVGRRRAGEAAHRSRSRSRSRSPSRQAAGRRKGRAPIVTANLLRSALREVDPLAAGAGGRGAKASVFERLGGGGGTAEAPPAAAAARVPARVAGSERADRMDRAMDTSGSGRKRGPEDVGDADADILGSPPKAARAALAQKPAGPSGGAEQAPEGRERLGPATGRQRLEFAPAAPTTTTAAGVARQNSGPKSGAGAGEGGPRPAGGDRPAAAAAAPPPAADDAPDAKLAELDLLRQQMALMQEKLARMEAAREASPPAAQVPPQPQPASQPPAQSAVQKPAPTASQPTQPQLQPHPQLQPPLQPQPQTVQPRLQMPAQLRQQQPPQLPHTQQAQVQVQPPKAAELRTLPIAARLQPPPQAQQQRPAAPTSAAAAGGRPAGPAAISAAGRGAGLAGGAVASILPTSRDDVIIEGGAGSPPRRPIATQQQRQQAAQTAMGAVAQPKVDQQRLAAAQLEADLRSVVVENVHFLATKEVLAAHFSVVGPVKNVTLVPDQLGRPTGVAVVEMANEAGTQAAAALSGSLLMELPIVVTLKAALLLQGMGFGMDSAAVAAAAALMPPLGAGPTVGGRLNPAAAPFVPGLGPMAGPGVGMGRGAAGRGGMGGAGRQAWGVAAGGRGRGGNVWVREPARPGNAVGPNAAEHS